MTPEPSNDTQRRYSRLDKGLQSVGKIQHGAYPTNLSSTALPRPLSIAHSELTLALVWLTRNARCPRCQVNLTTRHHATGAFTATRPPWVNITVGVPSVQLSGELMPCTLCPCPSFLFSTSAPPPSDHHHRRSRHW